MCLDFFPQSRHSGPSHGPVHETDPMHGMDFTTRNGSVVRMLVMFSAFIFTVLKSTDPAFPVGYTGTYKSRMGHVLCEGEHNEGSKQEGACDLHPLDLDAEYTGEALPFPGFGAGPGNLTPQASMCGRVAEWTVMDETAMRYDTPNLNGDIFSPTGRYQHHRPTGVGIEIIAGQSSYRILFENIVVLSWAAKARIAEYLRDLGNNLHQRGGPEIAVISPLVIAPQEEHPYHQVLVPSITQNGVEWGTFEKEPYGESMLMGTYRALRERRFVAEFNGEYARGRYVSIREREREMFRALHEPMMHNPVFDMSMVYQPADRISERIEKETTMAMEKIQAPKVVSNDVLDNGWPPKIAEHRDERVLSTTSV